MKKEKIIFTLIILPIGLIFYSHLILLLYYTIWISRPILIVYKVCFYSLTACYFFIIIFEIPYIGDKITKLIYVPGLITFLTIFLVMIALEIIILGINLSKVSDYWINCPFTITDPYEKLHYKRRCELYNINRNSRYKYQYICSYDNQKDFKYEYICYYNLNSKLVCVKEEKRIKQKIENDYILCVGHKSEITNNEIVHLFNKEYSNEKKYYCGRTNQPKKNNYVEDNNCNNSFKKNIFYFFYIICILQIGYPIVYYFFQLNYVSNIDDRNGRGNQNNIQYSINNNKSLSSTNISNNNNINFKRLNTKNIIYINQREISINQDINNISLDKSYKENKSNNINKEEIYKIKKRINK